MLSSLKKLFFSPSREQARQAYIALVAQSRRPVFYKQYGVPDTIDGRFDVMVLHLFLLIHRLRGEPAGSGVAPFIRDLSEIFFADMDRSLREMSVGDMGVGKRIRNMAQAFYGRLQAYEQTLLKPEKLQESLKRNLYRDAEVPEEKLEAAVQYVVASAGRLAAQDTAELLSGRVRFLD